MRAVVVGPSRLSALVLALEWLGISCVVIPLCALGELVADLRASSRRTRRCEGGQQAEHSSVWGVTGLEFVGIFVSASCEEKVQKEKVPL